MNDSTAPATAETAAHPVGVGTTTSYLPELESLRGIAIALVVGFHLDGMILFSALDAARRESSIAMAFVRAGFVGVDLFFVLSGFLLSLPFFAAAADHRSLSIRRYFERRALRILPLYYTVVLVTAVFAATRFTDVWRAVPYLLFLNSSPDFAFRLPNSTVWWSLATEVQFYLLLPLLAVFLRDRDGRLAGWIVLWAYGVAYALFLAGVLRAQSPLREHYLTLSVFGRGPLFLSGMFAAWLYRRAGRTIAARLHASAWLRRGGADLCLLGTWLAIGALLQAFLRTDLQLAGRVPYLGWLLVAGPLWSGILLLLLLAPLRLKPLFVNPVWHWLGIWSYSIYLLHVPVIEFSLRALRNAHRIGFVWAPDTALAALLICAGCVALSALSYRLIERPFLARKDRLGGTRVAVATPAAARPFWRGLDPDLLVLIPLALTVVAYAPIVGSYFFADDFRDLYRLVNAPFLEYLLTPHAGHVLVVRNALFALFHAALGARAELCFAAVLLTHLLNVWLLFGTLRALAGSAGLACLGAALWGVAPLHGDALGWYSVYGEVVATTALLLILRSVASVRAARRAPTLTERRWWYGLALAASASYGVGVGAALALPLVLVLLFPDWRTWTRRPPLLSLLVVVPALYVAAHALFVAISGEPIPGVRGAAVLLSFIDTIVPAGGPVHTPGDLALVLLATAPRALWMVVELVAYGLTQIVAGIPVLSRRWLPLWWVILALVAAAIVAAARRDPAARKPLLAFIGLALACYAAVAVGRAALLQLMPHPAIVGRFHYAASAALVVALCLALPALARRVALPRKTATAVLAVWLAWLAWRSVQFAPPIDTHAAFRGATSAVLDEITRAVATAPPGEPVYLANRPFVPLSLMVSPRDFPGWGALFAIAFPEDAVAGRPVRFVIADPAVVQTAPRGRRSAGLFVARDRVPPGRLVVDATGVDAAYPATPFWLPPVP